MEKNLQVEPLEPLEEIPEITDLLEAPDLDPGAWLAHDDSRVFGKVRVGQGFLKVAALTQDEIEQQRKAAQRLNPKDPSNPITDANRLSRNIICFSLNKANGTTIQPSELGNKLAGDLARIQREIIELSGLGDRDADLPFASSPNGK